MRCTSTAPVRDRVSDQWIAAAGRALHPAVRQPDADWLWAVTSGLARVAVPWELGPSRGDHQGQLVLATDQYEAWILPWEPGTRGTWHGHGEPSEFCVVAGEMLEIVLGPSGRQRVRRFGPGAGTTSAAGHEHMVTNPGPGTLTTMHVYLRPPESA